MAAEWFGLSPQLGRRHSPTGQLYALGETYSCREQIDALGKSLLWFSYRSGFDPLFGTSLTSDAHFGCLARTAQMIVANSIARTFVSADQTIGPLSKDNWLPIQADLQRMILQLFLDRPERPFSIHQICREGEVLGLQPGCWFGPSIVSHSFERLSFTAWERNAQQDSNDLIYQSPLLGCFRVLVMPNATIDEAAVLQLLDQGCGVLLLIQTKLGIDHTVNAAYYPELAAFFSLKQCMGIIGGRPGSSFYFIGVEGTETLFYLDPHVVQKCVDADSLLDFSTFHSPKVASMSFRSLDPSLAFGVYCSTRADLEAIKSYAAAANPGLFSVALPSSSSLSGSLAFINDDIFSSMNLGTADALPIRSLCEQDFSLLSMSHDVLSAVLADQTPPVIMVSDASGQVRLAPQDAQSDEDEFVLI